MKKLFLVCAIGFLGLGVSGQEKNLKTLLGVWECIDQKNERGSLEFIDSSKVYISFMGEKKPVSNYDLDFSKTPYWFSFSVKDSTETIVVKSFLYFIDDNNIRWEVFMPDDTGNPVSSEVVLLRRKSSAIASK
jgi:hypothetical protein